MSEIVVHSETEDAFLAADAQFKALEESWAWKRIVENTSARIKLLADTEERASQKGTLDADMEMRVARYRRSEAEAFIPRIKQDLARDLIRLREEAKLAGQARKDAQGGANGDGAKPADVRHGSPSGESVGGGGGAALGSVDERNHSGAGDQLRRIESMSIVREALG